MRNGNPAAPDFTELKTRQRALRESWPPDFSLRIHRAISWIGRAEREREDHAAGFLFLWIAFNAAYGGERFETGERDAFGMFFRRLDRLDEAGDSTASSVHGSRDRSACFWRTAMSSRRSGATIMASPKQPTGKAASPLRDSDSTWPCATGKP